MLLLFGETEKLQKLKNLIQHDILEAVQRNVTAGNLAVSEGQTLKRVALQIYNHIYNKYDELEEAGVNKMAEEALILDIDIIEWEHKKELERVKKKLTQELTEQFAKEKESSMRRMADKLRSLGVSEEEISELER